MDPLELRRKNFIPKEDFPAEVAVGIVYDSGDYHGLARQAARARRPRRRSAREQAELREQGIYRGIGFSTYMEICGLAPSRVVGPSGVGLQAGFWESAIVRVHPSGSATVYTGTVAARPGPRHRRSRRSSPTASGIDARPGRGHPRRHRHRPVRPGHLRLALARRRRRVGRRAANKVADKAKRIAAHLLEAAPEDIELADGKFSVKGSPDKGLTLAEIAGAAYVPREPARGHGAGARGDDVLRPGELRVPVRRARVRRRRRRRDRQGRRRALRRGRRLRPGDQPDADRRPGPRRHRARDRPGAVRAASSTTRTASS